MEEERLLRASQRTHPESSTKEPREVQKRKRERQTPEPLTDRHVKPKAERFTLPQRLPEVASLREQQSFRLSGIQFPE